MPERPTPTPRPQSPAPAPGNVHAPFHGIVTLLVEVGDVVHAGQVVATLEAMKMEAPITAPHGGTVTQTHLPGGTATVSGGDLLLVIS